MFAFVLVLLISFCTIAYAAIPTINYLTPSGVNGYYILGNSYAVSATVSDSPTSVTLNYTRRIPETIYNQGILSLSSGTTYTRTWIPNQYVGSYGSGGVYTCPMTFITATNSQGTSNVYKNTYVTSSSLTALKAFDSTFTYTSPTVSSFKGYGTGLVPVAHNTSGTYNCLAYSVGITDHWEWPWSGNPTFAQLQTYMTGKGYPTSSSTDNTYAKVIYYSGGHLSKVTAWSATGTPTKIISKWGCAELVESTNYSPFNATYGPATYYFK